MSRAARKDGDCLVTRSAGFSLVELMIAMVLGLLVVGAASAIFLSNQTTYRASEGVSRVQESARVAFELMAREARAAAGSACSNAVELDIGDAAALAFLNGIAIVNDGNNSLDEARDQLTMISGDDTAYRVTAATPGSVTVDLTETGLTNLDDAFEVGDRVLLCSGSVASIVTLSGVSGATLSFAPLPYDPLSPEVGPPASVMVARFRSHRWFVDDNGRGGSSLWVSRNGAAAEEVAEGVQSLRLQYLENRPPTSDAPLCPAAGSYTDGIANVQCVNALRLQMRLRGQDVEGRPLTRDFDNVVSLRSRNL